jgi:iron complex outermembrane receptor protein
MEYDLITLNSNLSNIPTSVQNTGFVQTEDVILSDYYIEDASFLRMDNITLGYTFENLLVKNSSLRVSAGVQNVFTITNYSGLDPEVFGGIDNTIYPRARTYFLGANIRF